MGSETQNINQQENELLKSLAPTAISVLKAKGIKNPEIVWQRMNSSIDIGGQPKEQAKTAINALLSYTSMPGMYQSQFPLDAFNPLKSAHYDFQNRKNDRGVLNETGDNLATIWNKGVIDFVQGIARIPQLFDTVTDKGAAFLGKLSGQTIEQNQANNNNSIAGQATNYLAEKGNSIADWLEHHAQIKTDDLYEQTKLALLQDGSINPNLSFLNTAVDGIASFVPTLAAAIFTDGAAAYPRLTTFLTSFTSTLDNYTRDLQNLGANKDTATLLGMTKAIIEGGFESLLGPEADIVKGLSTLSSIEKNIGKAAFKNSIKSLAQKELSPQHFVDLLKLTTTEKLKHIPITLLKQGGEEAFGEVLTEISTQGVNQIYDYLSPLDHTRFGDNVLSKKTFIDMVNAGVAGAIGGMAITGGHSLYNLKNDTYQPALFSYINSKVNQGISKQDVLGELGAVADKQKGFYDSFYDDNKDGSGVTNKNVLLGNISKIYDAAQQISSINPNIQDAMARYQIYDLSDKQKQLSSEIADYTSKLGEIDSQIAQLDANPSEDNLVARNAMLTNKYQLEKDASLIETKQQQLSLIDETFKTIGTTLKYDNTFKDKFAALAKPNSVDDNTPNENDGDKNIKPIVPNAKEAASKIGSDLLSGNIQLDDVANTVEIKSEIPQITTTDNEKVTTLRKGVPKDNRQLKGAMLEATQVETTSARDEVMKAFIGGAKLTRNALFDFFEKGRRNPNKNSTEILSRIGITNNRNGYESLDEFAHALWENSELNRYDEKYTDQDFRNAIEDILLSHVSTATMAKEILDYYKILNEQDQQQFSENELNDEIDSEVAKNYESNTENEIPNEAIEQINEKELSADEQQQYNEYLNNFTNEDGEVDWNKVFENSNDFFNDLFLNLPDSVQQKVFQDENKQTDKRKQSDTGTESETGNENSIHSQADKRQTSNAKTDQSEREQQSEQNLKDKEQKVTKLQNEFGKLQSKLTSNFEQNQSDLFGANKSQSMFDDRAEQQQLVDEKKAELDAAKIEFRKAQQDVERIKDEKNQTTLFDATEDKSSKQKRQEKLTTIDDNIANLWEDFASAVNAIKKLDGDGPNAQALATGIKLVSAYTEKGIYKLADITADMAEKFGEQAIKLLPYLKDAYNAVRGRTVKENRNNFNTEDEVFDFEIEDNNLKNNNQILDNSQNNNEITKANKDENSTDNDVGIRTNTDREQGQQSSGSLRTDSDRLSERRKSQDVQRDETIRETDSLGESQRIQLSDERLEFGEKRNGRTISEGTPLELTHGNSKRARKNLNQKLNANITDAITVNDTVEKSIAEPALQPTYVNNNFSFPLDDDGNKSFNVSKHYDDNIDAIKMLITLLKDDRKPTLDEKQILVKYVGFGGLKDVLLDPTKQTGWLASNAKYRDKVQVVYSLATELENLGIKDVISRIKASTQNAHYTSLPVIRSVYKAVKQLGFKNGKILEPSAGIGNFFGAMPFEMRSQSNLFGVELDEITGNILKYLYDDANIQVKGLQQTSLPESYFDLVVSNIPFGNYSVYDKALDNAKEKKHLNRIHNYFFAKAIKLTRPSGLIAFITSTGVMDSRGNEDLRNYIAAHTEFLGAIRLPNTAFKANANTEVTTDIIFLKKNNSTDNSSVPQVFEKTKQAQLPHKDDGKLETVFYNEYFHENPNMMLGTPVTGGLYARDGFALKEITDSDFSTLLEDAISQLPNNIYSESGVVKQSKQLVSNQQSKGANLKEGNLFVGTDGKIYKTGFVHENINGEKKLSSVLTDDVLNNTKNIAKVKAYIGLRDTLNSLYEAELNNAEEESLTGLRKELNKKYDNFHKNYGRLKSDKNKFISKDIDSYNVSALELKEKETGAITKADIFSKRTISPLLQVDKASSLEDAISVSLSENNSIDIHRIAALLGKQVSDVLSESNGLIFELPEGGFETRDKYLSGNVKEKLLLAKQAAEMDDKFQTNISQLEKVIPQDIRAVDIEVQLGTRWIPLEDYKDFVRELFHDNSIDIIYLPSTNTYKAESSKTVEATDKYGTKRINGVKLFLEGLQLNDARIMDTFKDVNGKDKQVLNVAETQFANEKLNLIREAFDNWIWKDEQRRERLSRLYNDKYNTSIRTVYNGSFLTFPGLSKFRLNPHQKDAIWMLNQNKGGIIDHIVGAGKTLIMVAGAMEMKRLGVAKKPMIAALKSTIPQIVESFREAYPLARILAPSETDFTAKKRKELLATIANNDFDCIIISHENYGKIPQSIEMQSEIIKEELDALQQDIDKLEAEGSPLSKAQLKGLEIRKENLTSKLQSLGSSSKDNELRTFQQLGVDHIFIDESQQFKNLAYSTKQRGVAGLGDPKGSKRSFNLLIGIRGLQKIHQGDKGVTFLSGTPISNSMVEMYLLLKYLRPRKLEQLGITTFDSWVSNFASKSTDIEFAVTGALSTKNRFRQFINVPELSILYTEIADVRTDENLVLDKPKMKSGGMIIQTIKQSEIQQDFSRKLIQFAKDKDGSKLGIGSLSQGQEKAYMLLATNLSSKMAIDMRLIDSTSEDNPNGKLARAADNIYKHYSESDFHRGTQLVFSDVGTPKSGNTVEDLKDYMQDEMGIDDESITNVFGNPQENTLPLQKVKDNLKEFLEYQDDEIMNLINESKLSTSSFNIYSDLKSKLIKKGIPANEIVFIHDYKTALSKQQLFDAVNSGRIRVVLGSTQKLGTGVNVQTRIVAMHHIDVPWRPSDMEQRNGRGIRQGNNIAKQFYDNEVAVYAYATELTLDAYKYQLLDIKQRFLTQVKTGAVGDTRTIKEGDGDAESGVGFAAFVATLSGNPDILEKAKVDAIVDKLKKSKRNHENELHNASSKISQKQATIENSKNSIEQLKTDIAFVNKLPKDLGGKLLYSATINGTVYDAPKGAGQALLIEREKLLKRPTGNALKFGEFYGLPIIGKLSYFDGNINIKSELYIEGKSGRSYGFTNSDDPTYMGRQISEWTTKIDDMLTAYQTGIVKNESDISKLKELAADVWDKEDEYKAALEKQKELSKRLNDLANENKKNENDTTSDTERDDTSVDTNADDDTEPTNEAKDKSSDSARYQRELRSIDSSIAAAKNLSTVIERRLTNSEQNRTIQQSENRQNDNGIETQSTGAVDKLQSTKSIASKIKLTPKQTEIIQKIISKVFPNVKMFNDIEKYNEVLKSINQNEISSTPTGFIYKGKLYLNPDKVNSSTQLHEVLHLTTSWSHKYAPDLYRKIIQSGKAAPMQIKEFVQNLYPELQVNSDSFHEEVFTTFAGEQLSKNVENLLQKAENKSWYNKVLDTMKELFSSMMTYAKTTLGIDMSDLKSNDFVNMNITEFAQYLGKRILSGKKLSDITSDEIIEIEQSRNESESEGESAIKSLTENENILFTKARQYLSNGVLLKDIYKDTGWTIDFNTGNWMYDDSHEIKNVIRFQKQNNNTQNNASAIHKNPQKTAVDVAFLNNKTTLEDLQTVIVSKNVKNLQNAVADIRNVFDPYIDVLSTAKTIKGNPFISEGILDAYSDDKKLHEVVMMMLDNQYQPSDKIIPHLFDALFTTTKGSILNQYKNWLEANNYTILQADNTGEVHQMLTEYDDKTDRQNIVDEKNKLANNKSGYMAKLFNLSINGKKLGSMMPKHFLFRSIWNEKTIANMFGKKGDAFYEVLSTAVDTARSIAMPYRTVAVQTENALIDKYKSLSVYGNHSNFNTVKKLNITAEDGNEYELTYGQAISIIGTAETQIADGYKREDGEFGISILDSKVKIENYKGEKDIEFSLDTKQYEHIKQTIFNDMQAKALFNELMEYYNRKVFKDIAGKTDSTKKSLFDTIAKIFMIDNAEKLELSNRYYPLQSYNVPIPQSTSAVAAESQLADDVSVLHNRTKSVSPLVIKDAIEALHDFNNKSINFVEYWLPTKNINTFVNRNEQWMRNNGLEYVVENLREYAKNLNNFDKLEYEANKGAFVKPIKSLVSAFAVSRLSFNLFTALKQFWGYPIVFGLNIIDNKYLQKELANTAKEMGVSYGALVREFQNYVAGKRVSSLVDIQPYINKIAENPYAYDVLYRLTNANLYNINDIISQSIGVNSYTDSKGVQYWNKFINFFKEVGFAQIKQADAAVIIGLYKAAQAQVNDTMPQASTDEKHKEIARLATEIMYATQQTNVLSDKTQIQLSHNIIDRTMSIFSAQTQKMVNTVAQLYIKYAKETDSIKKEEYGKQFTWSLNTMYIGNAMYMAFITTLAGLVRGGKDDGDDEQLSERFKWNFLRELANFIPGYTGQIATSVVTNFDNQKWSDNIGGVEVFKGVNDALNGIYAIVKSTYTDKSTTERNKMLHDGMQKAMKGMADVTGVSQELLRTLNPKRTF